HIGPPVLPGAEAELGRGLGRLARHVEGVLHVARGEGLAVVPLHVLPQEEDEIAVVVLPGPSLGELGYDGVGALERLERVEEDEVRVARRHGPDIGDGGRLVGEEPRRVLDEHGLEYAAFLGGLALGGQVRADQERGEQAKAERERAGTGQGHGVRWGSGGEKSARWGPGWGRA